MGSIIKMFKATSSSQVLSFNLTGVIILIVLKIAVIAYSVLQGGVTGRSSLYSPPGYSPADLTGGMCFLLYTNGEEDKLNCLSRAVCESPEVGSQYLAAAKLWYKMHKIINAVPYSRSTPRWWSLSRPPTPSGTRVETAHSSAGRLQTFVVQVLIINILTTTNPL